MMHQTGKVVKNRGITLRDSERAKDLELNLTYPCEPGEHPLIVFSHGAFGSKDGYGPLVQHWCANGFIVARPMHDDSLRYFAKERTANPETSRHFSTAEERKASLDAAFAAFRQKSFHNWRSRPLDISFVLNEIDILDAELGCEKITIARDKIGVGGHSFGAHTAQVLAGTILGGSAELADFRPRAFLLLSPQGMEEGFDGRSPTDEHSWENLNRPTMSITGTFDFGRDGQDHSWRFDCYKYSPAGDKYLVVLKDGHHGLGGVAGRHFQGAGPNNAEHVSVVQKLSLQFFEAYLAGSSAALSYLQNHEDEDALITFERK